MNRESIIAERVAKSVESKSEWILVESFDGHVKIRNRHRGSASAEHFVIIGDTLDNFHKPDNSGRMMDYTGAMTLEDGIDAFNRLAKSWREGYLALVER
jgi:hypothetical protein